LRVELMNFNATPGSNEVALSWTTASETNNDHFEIIRNNQKIAEVLTLGNDVAGHSYAYLDRTALNGTTYEYSLLAVDVSGNREVLSNTSATPRENAATVSEYALLQNYPNPFNVSTNFVFDLKENGFVTLKLYNISGQEVATLVNDNLESGRHFISFNAGSLPSGVYIYRLNVNNFAAEKKMLLIK
jgi:hypothetical protein